MRLAEDNWEGHNTIVYKSKSFVSHIPKISLPNQHTTTYLHLSSPNRERKTPLLGNLEPEGEKEKSSGGVF
jgi:hypothetical protein